MTEVRVAVLGGRGFRAWGVRVGGSGLRALRLEVSGLGLSVRGLGVSWGSRVDA